MRALIMLARTPVTGNQARILMFSRVLIVAVLNYAIAKTLMILKWVIGLNGCSLRTHALWVCLMKIGCYWWLMAAIRAGYSLIYFCAVLLIWRLKMKLTNIRSYGRYRNRETNKAVNIKKGKKKGYGYDVLFYLRSGQRVFVSDRELRDDWERVVELCQ
jgi:hypothetical protein